MEKFGRVEIPLKYKIQVCRYGSVSVCIECLENDPIQYEQCQKMVSRLIIHDQSDVRTELC